MGRIWAWIEGKKPGVVLRGYRFGVVLAAMVIFLTTWFFTVLGAGFLGFAVGWIPSAILAFVASFLWPLLMLGAGGTALAVYVPSWVSSWSSTPTIEQVTLEAQQLAEAVRRLKPKADAIQEACNILPPPQIGRVVTDRTAGAQDDPDRDRADLYRLRDRKFVVDVGAKCRALGL